MQLFRNFLNSRGVAHPHVVVPMLAIIGCWFLWKSYKSNHLTQDFTEMVSDVSVMAGKVVTNPQDRALIDIKMNEVQAIINKYKPQQSGGLFR